MAAGQAFVRGVGIISPLGLDARQTAASVRAGISRRAATSILDKFFEPIVMALVSDERLPALEPSLHGALLSERLTRMLRLATHPMKEALGPLAEPEEVPLLIGLPEAGQLPSFREDEFLLALSRQSGVRFHPRLSRTFPSGRASGILALEHALQLLAVEGRSHVLVGGVDTYYDSSILEALDKEDRLLTTDVLDGFIPAEAGAFVLIGAGAPPGPRQSRPVVKIGAVGTGREDGHLYSTATYTGSGLAGAFQTLFDGWDESRGPVRTVVAGLTGENIGAKEWGVAYLRNHSRFLEGFHLLHPVDCFGDPGAALGPLLLGVGAVGLGKGYLAGPCLIWCSSDREPRGAALLEAA